MPSRAFPFVHSIIDRHGKRRHYFRRSGQKSVALPGAWGSPEFQDAYRKALAGETAPRIEIGASRSKPGSVAAAVASYFGSMDFGALADATRRDRRRILELFRESHGEKNLAGLERKHVEIMLAAKASTPHSAKSFLKALRALVTVAIRAGLRDDDPTAGIRIKVRATGGFRTWTEDDIAQFETFYPIGSRARLAFALLLYMGQRRGDVIRMGRQHVRGALLMVRQAKTGATVANTNPSRAASDLRRFRGRSIDLPDDSDRQPFAPGAFTNWFGALCRAAGLPLGLSAHGLRKAMCRRLAEAGCSEKQISAISGHATLHEVARYTKAADQKRMARDAMEAITGTIIGNPAALNWKPHRK